MAPALASLHAERTPTSRMQMKLKLGVLLILLSFVPWLLLPVAAWLATSAASKATWAGALVLFGELLFWPGLLLAGRETWDVARFAGWRRAPWELWKKFRE